LTFITSAIDHNLDRLTHQEVYINYIATRPRAERLGSHGLFTDEDQPLVLPKVAETVAGHIGNIWTPIISIRREDAVRMGYDNASAWIALLRQQRNIFAGQMKIVPENLRWYAAFHNESHHPHCHMVVYSVNPHEGYVTRQAIEKMRSSLAREIFQQDLLHIYIEQTTWRSTLTEQSRNTLRELLEQMRTGTCENPVIEDLISKLAEKLKHTAGNSMAWIRKNARAGIASAASLFVGNAVAPCGGRRFTSENPLKKSSGAVISTLKIRRSAARRLSGMISCRRHLSLCGIN
jgi:hypothetical protein